MSIYQLLLHGAIQKNMGNGHRFYDALKKATVADLERARASLDRYGPYPSTHEARRLTAIRRVLAEHVAQNAEVQP